jgi:hypothetical protein
MKSVLPLLLTGGGTTATALPNVSTPQSFLTPTTCTSSTALTKPATTFVPKECSETQSLRAAFLNAPPPQPKPIT